MIMNCNSILLLKNKDKKSSRSTSMITKPLKNPITFNIKQNIFTLLAYNELNNYQFDKITNNSNNFIEFFNKQLNFQNNIVYVFVTNENDNDSGQNYFLQLFKCILEKTQAQQQLSIKMSICDINESEVLDVTTNSKTSIMSYDIQYMSELKKIMQRKEYIKQSEDCRFYKLEIFKDQQKLNQIIFLQTPYFQAFKVSDQVVNLFSKRKNSKKVNHLLNWGESFVLSKQCEINLISIIQDKPSKNPKNILDFVTQFKNNINRFKQMNHNYTKYNHETKENSRVLYTKQDTNKRQRQTYNKENLKSSLKVKESISKREKQPIKSQYLISKKHLIYNSESQSQDLSQQQQQIRTGRTIDKIQGKKSAESILQNLQKQNKYLKSKLKNQTQQFLSQKQQLIQKYKKKSSRLKHENQKLKCQLKEEKQDNEQLNNKLAGYQNCQTIKLSQLTKQSSHFRIQNENLLKQIGQYKNELSQQKEKNLTELKKREDEIQNLKKKIDMNENLNSNNLDKLQNEIAQMQKYIRKLKQQIQIHKQNENKYLEEISNLEYRFLKQRGKYVAEKQNNKKLSQELQIMDIKLHNIINLKNKQIKKLQYQTQFDYSRQNF